MSHILLYMSLSTMDLMIETNILQYTRLYMEQLKLNLYEVKDCEALIIDSLTKQSELRPLSVKYLKENKTSSGKKFFTRTRRSLFCLKSLVNWQREFIRVCIDIT